MLITLPIDVIQPNQETVSIDILTRIFKGEQRDEVPKVSLENGIYWLEDGHHRYTVNLLTGKTSMEVELMNG